jgi:hypothetical protein
MVRVGGVRQPDQAVISLRPFKSGYLFIPDSLNKVLSRIDDCPDGGGVVLPDIRGIDCATFSASDYFPLRSGASWTYARTGGAPSPGGEEYTISIADNTFTYGQIYFHAAPSGPAGFADLRIMGESVLALQNAGESEILRFGVPPGTQWKAGTVSGVYPRTGVFLGVDTVTTPAGTFPGCLKYEIRTTYGGSSYESCTLWLARGTGMVKSVRTLVNFNEPRETITDLLKSATR